MALSISSPCSHFGRVSTELSCITGKLQSETALPLGGRGVPVSEWARRREGASARAAGAAARNPVRRFAGGVCVLLHFVCDAIGRHWRAGPGAAAWLTRCAGPALPRVSHRPNQRLPFTVSVTPD